MLYWSQFAKANWFSGNKFVYANIVADGGGKEIQMPLVLAPIGQEVRIVKIVADEKTKKHLANLGLLVDATVTVLSSAGGSTVCRVKEGRLALDKNVAAHIYVA